MNNQRIPENYPSRTILLPRLLQVNSTTFLMNYLKLDEMGHAYELAKAVADHGYNIGLDEYNSAEEFDILFKDAEMFSIKDSIGTLHAVICIHPSWFARSQSTCLATLVIIPSRYLMENSENYRKLVRLGCELVVELDLHYEICVMNMFVCCLDMYLELKKEGFSPQMTIPMAGEVKGQGIQQSYIMVKRLQVKPKKHRSVEEVCAMIDKYTEGTEEAFEQVFKSLPPINFLPMIYTFSSGLQVTIRQPKSHRDLITMYELMCTATSQGKGYGIDEFPSQRFFLEMFLPDSHIAVAVDNQRGTIMAFMVILPHWCVRTRRRKIADTAIVIHPNYRSNNVGGEFMYLTLQVSQALGYVATFSDTLVTNLPMLKVCQRIGYTPIGVFPHSTYLSKHGWTDSVVVYNDFSTVQNLFDDTKVKKTTKL